MSGITVSLMKRRYCDAGGRDYTAYFRRDTPDEHKRMRCPACGKRITLKIKASTGLPSIIPRHVEQVVGM